MSNESTATPMSYADAGVDIDAANEAVSLMSDAVRSTHTSAVLNDVGAFGGLFSASGLGPDAVLAASTDGVGTKVELAARLGRWRGIGHDLVNHCTNDILVQNARPLFFLDYVATAKLVPEHIAEIVTGLSEACAAVGAALLGGETAEMPGVYVDGAVDVAGTIVGVVDRDQVLPRTDAMAAGSVLVGVPSSGPHTNGYSLIRALIEDRDLDMALSDGRTLADALLAPHRAYVAEVDAWQAAGVELLGLAHLTGGGFIENLPRVLPDDVTASVRLDSWETPELFQLLVEWGSIDVIEAHRTFNMGIGLIAIVAPDQVDAALAAVSESMVIGELTARGDLAVELV